MTETCHDCQEEYEGFPELAQHIISQRKTHRRKSVVWAEIFLSRRNNVQEFKPRSPMSDELRQTLKDCVRELSGKTKKGLVKCPQCRQLHSAEIEIEHLQDWAWREDGKLMVLCGDCRRAK